MKSKKFFQVFWLFWLRPHFYRLFVQMCIKLGGRATFLKLLFKHQKKYAKHYMSRGTEHYYTSQKTIDMNLRSYTHVAWTLTVSLHLAVDSC
ncbi:hypothetical protein CCL20_24640 [Pseudomonas syringae]|nr:hypothetical protein CCL20_24640 [Pseudomonas syringae]